MEQGSTRLDETIRGLCRDHDLKLLSVLSSSETAFAAQVQNARGDRFVLKRMRPDGVDSQLAALGVWEGSGLVPHVHAVLAPGLYLLDWVSGITMADWPALAPAELIAVGRALSTLHETPPPRAAPDFRDSFAWLAISWDALTPSLAHLAAELTAMLARTDPQPPVLLHGDLVPYNIVITNGGPRFIDPIGSWGLPAWDIAKLAVGWVAMGRNRILASLIQGYGREPALLAETVTWTALVYLQKNLPFPDSPLLPHLLPLATELMVARTAQGFLRGFLPSDVRAHRV